MHESCGNSMFLCMAFGMTIILINNMTDLSMGAVLAFGGLVGVDIYLKTGSFPLAILAAMAISMLCGLVNAFTIMQC